MNTYPFPKSYRLIRSAEFRKVYNEGKTVRSKAFQLFYLMGEENKPARLGITVTRSYGKAVQRNRVKRLIREAFRRAHSCLKFGYQMVINVRSQAEGLTQKEVSSELENLFSKAGLNRSAD
ncbi:ribonuclease P protein component [Candidatus Sumerlaeota bacterium]|nr:ribonuclease P protein component [Candidatus Sumerlaeota bacterium]